MAANSTPEYRYPSSKAIFINVSNYWIRSQVAIRCGTRDGRSSALNRKFLRQKGHWTCHFAHNTSTQFCSLLIYFRPRVSEPIVMNDSNSSNYEPRAEVKHTEGSLKIECMCVFLLARKVGVFMAHFHRDWPWRNAIDIWWMQAASNNYGTRIGTREHAASWDYDAPDWASHVISRRNKFQRKPDFCTTK